VTAVVIDTNVGVVANEGSPQADPVCVEAVLRRLQEVQDSGLVVIDDQFRILGEYLDNSSPSVLGGAGDRFIYWLLQNQGNPERCEQVHLTAVADPMREFDQFPSDPRLAKFDPADRKWVAVARASRHHPAILNAVDSDWREHAVALAENGVRVECLCPHLPLRTS
jgi:hypothetical protein